MNIDYESMLKNVTQKRVAIRNNNNNNNHKKTILNLEISLNNLSLENSF